MGALLVGVLDLYKKYSTAVKGGLFLGQVVALEVIGDRQKERFFVLFGGDKPEFYDHEVWFEYAGGESNHASGRCPGLPEETPIPDTETPLPPTETSTPPTETPVSNMPGP